MFVVVQNSAEKSCYFSTITSRPWLEFLLLEKGDYLRFCSPAFSNVTSSIYGLCVIPEIYNRFTSSPSYWPTQYTIRKTWRHYTTCLRRFSYIDSHFSASLYAHLTLLNSRPSLQRFFTGILLHLPRLARLVFSCCCQGRRTYALSGGWSSSAHPSSVQEWPSQFGHFSWVQVRLG